ncbi:hypothetical protein JANAI62_26400 [Jannaschia pagri]|uniref:Methyltransferase domain-containing protein n=1 Tax=Jannaschia pagri TaxID=2829797 RepID=A0ABQ4NNN3_9RHOB|nr:MULTISPECIES: methyltransferase domain-containing protein [unclassified Jannaschia]GIT92182.1 hypothetical protein JANAI61_26400 [Jannaschia sp. AI_61]GIT96017.1 hypothetical protein JANAI62_26400 [Jannaschia sp. AI_62]
MTSPDTGNLWTARTPADTRQLYDDWATNYDTDMADWGYLGPARCAEMLLRHGPGGAVHDFGCGTGLAGAALAERGVTTVDGSDLSDRMLQQAQDRNLYRTLALAEAGAAISFAPDVTAVLACGVISYGAAPATLLGDLIQALPKGGLLVMTYNDTTLTDDAYQIALAQVQGSGEARLLQAEYGPQLPGQDRGCTVYALRRM